MNYSNANRNPPFVRIDHFNDSKDLTNERDFIHVGFNVKLNSQLFLKAEYAAYEHDRDSVFQSRDVVAFYGDRYYIYLSQTY